MGSLSFFTITNKNDLFQIILKVNTGNLLICVRVIDFLIKNYTFILHRAHYISTVYHVGREPSHNVYAVKKYYYIYYKLQFKRYVGIERFLQSQRGLFFDATKFYFWYESSEGYEEGERESCQVYII